MLQVHTKLTSQGQVSVPSAIRNLLGLTPGAMIEWTQVGNQVVVTRAIRHNTSEVHLALFPQRPDGSPAVASATTAATVATPAKTLSELKAGIRQHMQRQHARG